jgi:hypothetical protein
MPTKLKGLYRSLGLFQVATQMAMCEDLIRRAATLAKCFAEAVERNSAFDNRVQPFLTEAALAEREASGPDDSNEYRVIALLRDRGDVEVDGVPEGYIFRYIARQVPPLRMAGADRRHSGKGRIDYIARMGYTPILGEVKCNGDQNAFYAFIQILTYLSEVATTNQVERANRHNAFGNGVVIHPPFDLHILLADRNPKSKTEEIVEATRELAIAFRRALARHHGAANVLGRILCLGLDTSRFRQSADGGIRCRWIQ